MSSFSIKDFIQEKFSDLVLSGGEIAFTDQAEERLSICANCPFKGDVYPDPMIGAMDGCTLCGCPSSTKPHMKSFYRRKGKDKDTPLTAQEVLEASTLVKLFPDKYELYKIECPHPDGNKWKEIDSKYE